MDESFKTEFKELKQKIIGLELKLDAHIKEHASNLDTDKISRINIELKDKKKLSVYDVIGLLHLSKPMALRYMKECETGNTNIVFCLGKPGNNNCSRLLYMDGENHFVRMCKEIISSMLNDRDPDCTKFVGPALEYYGFEHLTDEEVVNFIKLIITNSRGRIIAVYPKTLDHNVDKKRIRQTRLLKVG
jgi:hypothetical protein